MAIPNERPLSRECLSRLRAEIALARRRRPNHELTESWHIPPDKRQLVMLVGRAPRASISERRAFRRSLWHTSCSPYT